MSPPPLVTVITPTYNHERYLAACIDSLRAQTFTDWEQIVVDDGSTDGTRGVAQRYDDPRIRYVAQEHVGLEGLAGTYNRALAQARGSLIAILEGDDTWPADKLASQVPVFDDPEVVLAYGRSEVFGEGRHDFPPFIPSPEFERRFGLDALENRPVGRAAVAKLDFRGLTFTYPVSVMLRRTTLEAIGGFQFRPGLLVTDHPTFLRMALEGRFHFTPRTMGHWRVHPGSSTVARMDQILQALWREVGRFREQHGGRLDLTAADWRRLEKSWDVFMGWRELRHARRALVERRGDDARGHLAQALRVGRLTTKVTSVVGYAASCLGLSVELVYRWRGRAWYRTAPDGRAELVMQGQHT